MINIILLVILSGSAAPEFSSPVAKRAERTFAQAMKWAELEFDKQVKQARADYHTQLRAALDISLKARDLDEANRIDAALKDEAEPAVDRADLERKLIGSSWAQVEHAAKFTLEADHVIDSHTNPNRAVIGRGTWAILDDGRIRIALPGLGHQTMRITGNTMAGDGMTWRRER